MRVTTLFNRLLNLQGLRVVGFRFDGDDLILSVRPRFRRLTCPHCGKSCSGRASTSHRSWRHLGIWGHRVWLEGPIRRLRCRTCERTVTESVPWARHGSDFTRAFEDAVGLMAQRTDQTAVSQLFGISWGDGWQHRRAPRGRVAGSWPPVEPAADRRRRDQLPQAAPLPDVVTDHDTGNVVWVCEGKTSDVLKGFFESLGPDVCNAIEIVTMDMSQAYQKAVRDTLRNATIAFDHFHVAKLANEALNEVRRELVREARVSDPALAKEIKGMRWPTLYSLENVPAKHLDSLAALRPDAPLGRAYLLKEQLLEALRHQRHRIAENLKTWTSWASRSRLAPFVRLGRTIREHARGICAFVQKRVTNARAEGINNKIRLLSHRAYGFHSAAPLIATVYLCCGGIRLPEQLQLL